MKHLEDDLQKLCIKWFDYAYPKLWLNLHHSPNGGKRNLIEAAKFKAMGTRRGFPDIALLCPSKGYHGLFIELKTEKGRQSPSQREWQKNIEQYNYKYVICRSLDDFIKTIKDYLNDV